MESLVLYDSTFGNTKHLAEVIGQELATHGPARVVAVDQANGGLGTADLLVVGA
jgi:menaquinone-dependent protoporphyrinogen IX oxidase